MFAHGHHAHGGASAVIILTDIAFWYCYCKTRISRFERKNVMLKKEQLYLQKKNLIAAKEQQKSNTFLQNNDNQTS